MGAVILLLAALCVVVANAEPANISSASNISDESYVITDEPLYEFTPVYRLSAQGATVYINDTVDLRGQGWNSGLAWYGKYSEYEYPRYIIDYNFNPYSAQNPKQFYIDPVVFTGRSGPWYQFYGNTTERNGNLISFKVKEEYRNYTLTLPNGQVFNMSEVLINRTIIEPRVPKEVIMPEVPITGYLIAKGESLTTNLSKVWIFGNTKGLYDKTGYITKEQIQTLPVGSYKLVRQEPGNNTIIEVGYDSTTNQLTSPWKGVASIPLEGLQPMMVKDLFMGMVGKTDDIIETYNMEFEEPSITINRYDEVDVGTRTVYKYEPGMTLLDVRGYSNVANGTKLYFIIDPNKQNARSIEQNTYTTEAIKTSHGNKSYYRVYIPINKNLMTNEMHTIKAYTEIGGFIFADFPVSEMPADSFIPNASAKYIGDRNPWVPTPTPEVRIQKEIVTVKEQVPVLIPPSDAQISEAAQRIIDDQNRKVEGLIVLGIVGMFILAFMGWVIYSMWRAKRK